MRLTKMRSVWIAVAVSVAVSAGLTATLLSDREPMSMGGPGVVRKLSPEQYLNTITDTFGRGIPFTPAFEPEFRSGGLLAVGAKDSSVTATGFMWYDEMARQIAAAVVNEPFRTTLIPCRPGSPQKPDDVCAGQFLEAVASKLYRRPLSETERRTLVAIAGEGAAALSDFYAGLSVGLATVLSSPDFLFRKETITANDGAPVASLTSYAKASRLSYFLWNAAPDGELLRAAGAGELETQHGLVRQVDRMLASPRLERGIRAFFSDLFHLRDLNTLAKDVTLYPKFIPEAAKDAQEQLLRTIVFHVSQPGNDYRDLLVARKTFLTPLLGALYKAPVPEVTPNGDLPGWVPYEYPAGDPRASILTLAAFAALHSHPGRSSPTLRGRALREILLCQKVPDPPGDVQFTVVQDTNNPLFKTARERLAAHATEPACAGCHKLTDPVGLALETFDTTGAYRTEENDAAIDASGEFDGRQFKDTSGLLRILRDDPGVPSCLVTRLYSYAVGRVPARGESDLLEFYERSFAKNGYDFISLMRKMAISNGIYQVAPTVSQQTADASEKIR